MVHKYPKDIPYHFVVQWKTKDGNTAGIAFATKEQADRCWSALRKDGTIAKIVKYFGADHGG